MGLPPAARIKCRPAVKTWLGTACYLELGQLLHVFASLLTYIDSGRFVLFLQVHCASEVNATPFTEVIRSVTFCALPPWSTDPSTPVLAVDCCIWKAVIHEDGCLVQQVKAEAGQWWVFRDSINKFDAILQQVALCIIMLPCYVTYP